MEFTGFPAIIVFSIVFFIFLGVPIAIVASIISRASRFAHREHSLAQQSVVAEYDAPEGLSPAEIGYLFDSRIGTEELMGTLIALEQQGIVEISDSNLVGLKATRMPGLQPPSLKLHEQYIIDHLPNSASLAVYGLEHLGGFKACVVKLLRDQDLIKPEAQIMAYLFKRTLIAYVIISAIIFILSVSGTSGDKVGAIIAYIFFGIFLFPLFFGLAVVVGMIYDRMVGRPGQWTDRRTQLWPQIEGYREYVRQVEVDEINFESKESKTASKNKTLPYAIALGLNTDWQKRFSPGESA